jgi:hypothetical protein
LLFQVLEFNFLGQLMVLLVVFDQLLNFVLELSYSLLLFIFVFFVLVDFLLFLVFALFEVSDLVDFVVGHTDCGLHLLSAVKN